MPTPEMRLAQRGGLPSLRLRFMLVILLGLAVGVPVSAVLDYRDSIRLANEGYDHAIASLADILADAVVPVASDREKLLAAAREVGARVAHADPDDSVRFAVVGLSGELLAGDPGLAALAAKPTSRRPVFADTRIGDQSWRAVTLRATAGDAAADDGDLWVVVAESMGKRNQIAGDILGNVVYVNIFTFLLLSLVLLLATGWVMAPLLRLGRAVDARRPEDLRPLAVEGLPTEAGSLVDAINRLLERLERSRADEQAFLSAAAHQLRTPLATMTARLELTSRNTDAETARRLGEVVESGRELAHVTHQMLTLARAGDGIDRFVDAEHIDLAALLTDVANRRLDRALARSIDLGFDIGCSGMHGVGWLLREALLNLVDNALLHARDASRITIACCAEGDDVLLVVEDDGCGIPLEAQAAVFERFRRGDTPAPGSGLGLAIVRAAAEAHGGSVSLQAPAEGRGCRFVMRLPRT